MMATQGQGGTELSDLPVLCHTGVDCWHRWQAGGHIPELQRPWPGLRVWWQGGQGRIQAM